MMTKCSLMTSPGIAEDPFDDVSGEESYAPISANRESFLDSPSNEATQQDHLKPPTPIQRHRSVTRTSFDEKLRNSKRRSVQNIQRRSKSKSAVIEAQVLYPEIISEGMT